MEARLTARIEGHGGGFEPRATVAIFNNEHASDEEPLFDVEFVYDTEPVFDAPQQSILVLSIVGFSIIVL
jgi:hypothetical protein